MKTGRGQAVAIVTVVLGLLTVAVTGFYLIGLNRRGVLPHAVWKRRIDFPAVTIAGAGGDHYFLVGSPSQEEPRLVVAKINRVGEELWRRGHELGPGWWVADAASTRDGGCVVLGCTGGWWSRETDIFLLRTDPEGQKTWQSRFGGPSFEWAKNVLSTPDGGFVVAGTTASFGAGNLDFYLLKVTPSGGLAWQKTFGADGWEGQYESSPSVTLTRDGGYLLVGSTDSKSLAGDNSVQVYAVRTDPQGGKLLERVLGDRQGFDVGATALELDSGYILGGTRCNFRPGVFLERLSEGGKVLWEVTAGHHHGDGNLPMLLLPGGNTVAGTGYWDNSRSDVAAYLLQVDSAGRIQWELEKDEMMGRVLDLQETEDHGVLVLCEGRNQEQGLLVKLPPH